MDSLLANYASDDDDDERGGVGQEEKAAAESLQLNPPKPSSSSSLLSSSLPPPKPSAALSSSLFSTLPPPKSLASAPSPAPTIPSRPTPIHLGEVHGDKETSGILTTGTPSSTAFKAQSSLFSSLPPPKPSSSFFEPTSSQLGGECSDEEEEEAGIFTTYTTSSNPFSAHKSMFSSIPLPKDSSTPSFSSSVPPPKFEQRNSLNIANPPSSDRNPKKVVQFKLPLNPSLLKSEDSDDDEDNVNMRKRSVKDSSSNVPNASSSLFSILPAPKSTLGLVPSSATASSRRSVIDADVSASNTGGFAVAKESGTYGESGADESYSGGWVDAPTEIGAEDVNAAGFVDSSAGGWEPPGVEETAYPGYDGSNAASYWDPSYGGAIDYGSYEGNWSETAVAVNSDVPDLGRIAGKRGRNEFPTELMEVNQDELMKNRPRQDQSRLTGIAFGPSHQPASSGKGKPSKLHKRKHQIGSLYFDMKQKEMELAERRSRGLLTKTETQAKYGW